MNCRCEVTHVDSGESALRIELNSLQGDLAARRVDQYRSSAQPGHSAVNAFRHDDPDTPIDHQTGAVTGGIESDDLAPRVGLENRAAEVPAGCGFAAVVGVNSGKRDKCPVERLSVGRRGDKAHTENDAQESHDFPLESRLVGNADVN